MINGMTQIPDETLKALAAKYETPLYIFEEAVIRSKCRELKSAINYPRTVIRYACKALTLQAILKIIKDEGLWIDASSLNEVLRALQAGFLPEEIYYTGEGATLAVYEQLVQLGVLINCTSLDQIRLLGQVSGRSVCSLRINPGEGNGEITKTNTGGPSSKHGIYFNQVDEAKSLADEAGLRIIGIHAHIGSGGHDIEPWLRIKDLTLAIASTFADLQFVNLGGGLPVVYHPERQKPMPVEAWGKALSASMVEFSEKMGREITLQIEPGRYIVAHSGTILAEVQAIKDTPAYRFAIVNTGLNHNIRPSLYASYHPIRFIQGSPRTNLQKFDYVIAGYLCESGDVFTVKSDGSGVLEPRAFDEIKVGDLMVMGCVGAYAHAMKNEYNSMNLPASVLINTDGTPKLIERRGTLDDMMLRERETD